MNGFLAFLAGAAGGFLAHSLTMKVSFKQRAIENKIRVYDSLIGKWVQMRNFVYAHHPGDSNAAVPGETLRQFDHMYGESQQLIGEAILVCEEISLTNDINQLNEALYRTPWHDLSSEDADTKMEEIKRDAIELIGRMREDIKASTRLEWQDFVHIFSGLRRKQDIT